MENKKIKTGILNFSLFRERFLTFKDEKALEVAQTAEALEFQKRKNFFLEQLQSLMSGGNLKLAEGSYPYSKEMEDFLKNLPDLSGATFENPEKKDGKLIVKYSENGEKKELVMEGGVYIALFWNDLKDKLESGMFNGKNVSNALLLSGLEQNAPTPKFKELMEKLVKEGVDKVANDDPLVAPALAELDTLRGALDAKSTKERKEVKTEVETKKELDAMKYEIEDPKLTKILGGLRPESLSAEEFEKQSKAQNPRPEILNADEFEKQSKAMLDDLTKSMKEWKAIILRGDYKINADNWDPKSRQGLNVIFKDLNTLGISTNNRFFEKMFSELGKCSDENFLGRQDISENNKSLYRDPLKNLDELRKMGDPGFASAVNSLVAIKAMVNQADIEEKNTIANLNKLGKEPITDTATKFVKDNLNKFTEAVRTKDWGTAAVYAGGVYMLWKSWKWMADAKDPKDSTKALFPNLKNWAYLAGGLYAANIFAKNAGYDLPKKLGLQDMDAEVKGTPLSKFYTLD
ncbi:MAG: hypothetical protein PHP74_03340, partial [Candidatus Gracilibacteria bacterium]|nr:hypothetical protein [Candidatus Gracilibacteria bacterium]